jgi:hypothetical protein
MKNGFTTSLRTVLIVAFTTVFGSMSVLYGGAFNSEQKTQIYSGCQLPAMQNVHVSDKTETSFTLEWDAVAGSAGYAIKIYKLNPDGSQPAVALEDKVIVGRLNVTFNRLLPGKYRVISAAVCEEDMRGLVLRTGGQTGDPTVTNIVVDDILFLKTQPIGNSQTGVRILVTKESPVSLGVFDITGKQVINIYNHKNLNEGVYFETVNTEGLNQGIYIVRLQVGNKVETSKVLKM